MTNTPPATVAEPAILYYDGQCPLCTKEMDRLEKLKNQHLLLADIHTLAPDPDLPDKDTLLRTLHLRLPNGQLLTGANANVAAWQYTRHGTWFRWLRWPLIRQFVDRLYDFWAQRRYQRIYGRPCALRKEL
jgi:predicted DCC family thiol-disulfide oxidoreductase YuxK